MVMVEKAEVVHPESFSQLFWAHLSQPLQPSSFSSYHSLHLTKMNQPQSLMKIPPRLSFSWVTIYTLFLKLQLQLCCYPLAVSKGSEELASCCSLIRRDHKLNQTCLGCYTQINPYLCFQNHHISHWLGRLAQLIPQFVNRQRHWL